MIIKIVAADVDYDMAADVESNVDADMAHFFQANNFGPPFFGPISLLQLAQIAH